jgi:hypothetical protein
MSIRKPVELGDRRLLTLCFIFWTPKTAPKNKLILLKIK